MLNAFRTLKGRDQVTFFEERINQNQSLSKFSKSQGDKLEKISQVAIHFNPCSPRHLCLLLEH